MCRIFDCKVVDADHLLQALRAKYTISTDWEASLYIGITLKRDYTAGHVNLSMPKYFIKALHRFKNSLKNSFPTISQNILRINV